MESVGAEVLFGKVNLLCALVFSSVRTTDYDIKKSLEAILRIAKVAIAE